MIHKYRVHWVCVWSFGLQRNRSKFQPTADINDNNGWLAGNMLRRRHSRSKSTHPANYTIQARAVARRNTQARLHRVSDCTSVDGGGVARTLCRHFPRAAYLFAYTDTRTVHIHTRKPPLTTPTSAWRGAANAPFKNNTYSHLSCSNERRHRQDDGLACRRCWATSPS